ncbi:MAG: hypothetical protein V8Q30_04370 [Acutalibacteraceae bacterium]
MPKILLRISPELARLEEQFRLLPGQAACYNGFKWALRSPEMHDTVCRAVQNCPGGTGLR